MHAKDKIGVVAVVDKKKMIMDKAEGLNRYNHKGITVKVCSDNSTRKWGLYTMMCDLKEINAFGQKVGLYNEKR